MPLLLGYLALADSRGLFPFDPDQPLPSLVVDEPQAGKIGYPTPVRGRIQRRALDDSEEVWAGSLGPTGRAYTQDAPCADLPDSTFDCGDVFVGTAEASTASSFRVCVFIVSDSTQFKAYAARPDPNKNNPGLMLKRHGLVRQTCVPVTR